MKNKADGQSNFLFAGQCSTPRGWRRTKVEPGRILKRKNKKNNEFIKKNK